MCKMNTDPLIPYFPFFAIGLFCVCFVCRLSVWLSGPNRIANTWMILFFRNSMHARIAAFVWLLYRIGFKSKFISPQSLFNVCACLRACVCASWQHTHTHIRYTIHRDRKDRLILFVRQELFAEYARYTIRHRYAFCIRALQIITHCIHYDI